MYRVNKQNEFNSPYGNYKNIDIVNEKGLRAVSSFFNSISVTFLSVSYEKVLENISADTFVYLDPPYDPISSTSSFTSYTKYKFDKEDHIKLRDWCDRLTVKGIKFMLSNSSTSFIKEIYKEYNITKVQANRIINNVGNKRGPIDELVIRNY